MKNITLLISFFFFLSCLICTQQQSVDLSGCDTANPFRLITRMSGKSLYVVPGTSDVNLNFILNF